MIRTRESPLPLASTMRIMNGLAHALLAGGASGHSNTRTENRSTTRKLKLVKGSSFQRSVINARSTPLPSIPILPRPLPEFTLFLSLLAGGCSRSTPRLRPVLAKHVPPA